MNKDNLKKQSWVLAWAIVITMSLYVHNRFIYGITLLGALLCIQLINNELTKKTKEIQEYEKEN